MGTSNKANKNDMLEGMKSESITNLYFFRQIILTPMNIDKDKENVIIRWLVIVKLYGIKPLKLANNIKVKITEIKGKYFSPSTLMLSKSNWEVVSYNVSTNTCHVLGIRKNVPSFSRSMEIK